MSVTDLSGMACLWFEREKCL